VDDLVQAMKSGKMIFQSHSNLTESDQGETRTKSRSLPTDGATDRAKRKVFTNVVSDEQSSKILRLEKIRQMIIDSKVFSENDELLKTINAGIESENRKGEAD